MRDYKFNTDNLTPVVTRQRELTRLIEDAEWMEQDAHSLYCEMEELRAEIARGSLYVANF